MKDRSPWAVRFGQRLPEEPGESGEASRLRQWLKDRSWWGCEPGAFEDKEPMWPGESGTVAQGEMEGLRCGMWASSSWLSPE